MKSKLFIHKFFIVLCISVAALLGLSFLARATIVNNRFEQMAVDRKYRLKASADGQFLIQLFTIVALARKDKPSKAATEMQRTMKNL